MRPLKNNPPVWPRLALVVLGAVVTALLAACSGSVTPGAQLATSTQRPYFTPAPTDAPGVVPIEFQTVYQYLTRNLGVNAEQVAFTALEERVWNDSCLELGGPAESCAQIATPGFLLRFDTPYGPVEFHTDDTGEEFRMAPGATLPFGADPVMQYQRSSLDIDYCRFLVVYDNGAYAIQSCGEAEEVITPGSLSEAQKAEVQQQLAEWGDVRGDIRWGTETNRYIDQFRWFGQGSAITETQVLETSVKGLADALLGGPGGAELGISGIEGQALLQPACSDPINAPDACAEQPFAVTVVVLTAAGQPMGEFQTDAEGRFRLDLPAGDYILRPQVTDFVPEIAEWPVTVYPGEFTAVDIVVDVQE